MERPTRPETDDPDEDFAYFLSQLARYHYFAGTSTSRGANERALALAGAFG
jgi:hypothetical protein